MPIISTDIPDHQDYISRPIAMAVVEQLMGFMRLRTSDIIFRGLASQPKNVGSTLGDEDALQPLSDKNQVMMTVEEEFLPDSLLTTSILQKSKRTIFHDDESKVYMAPVRKDATMLIEVTYNASSAAEARDWRNRMQQLLERRMEILTHELSYTYPIPVELVSAVTSVHKLRESGAHKYGQTLGEYLKAKFAPKVAVATDLAGRRHQLVVEEKQHDIQGALTFDEVPQVSKDETSYAITFSYKLHYEKPYAMILDYPLTINNQVVSQDLRPRVDYNELLPKDASVVRGWFDGVLEVNEPTQGRIGGFSIPGMDSWQVPHPPAGTGSIFRILITVDVNKPQLILNINELGQYRLNEKIVDLMTEAGNMLFEYAHCPVLVQFYEDDKPIDPKLLDFDGENISIKQRELDPSKSYHLRIALITNLAMLAEPATDMMLRHPLATRSIMLALEPSLISANLMPPVINGRIEDLAFRKAMDYINYTSPNYNVGHAGRIRVAFVTISAQRS